MSRLVNPEKKRNLSSNNLLCLPPGYFLTSTFPLKHVRLLPPVPRAGWGRGGEFHHVMNRFRSAHFIKPEHVAFHQNINETYPPEVRTTRDSRLHPYPALL